MIFPYAVLFSVLTFFAALSPLVTFARLWQIKEWRWDRLREHLRENGWYRQLFGTVRPPLIAILFVLSGFRVFWVVDGAILGLFVLVILSLLQIVFGKQPRPVWTMKARALVSSASLLIVAVSSLIFVYSDIYSGGSMALLVMPLLAPLFLVISWILLRPVDIFLKNRTLNRAKNFRSAHPDITVIGITGSVGKTTTKELLAHILKEKNALATPSHVNTEMGVAAWITKTLRNEPADSKKILIVEMGAYHEGEIKLLCDITKPCYGIITYVGDQHVALFGSHEAIIQAKGELFDALPPEGKAFGNSDNDAYPKLAARCRCGVVSVGTGQHADIQATDIEETAAGLSFRALDTAFKVPIAGTHSIASILLAIAVAKEVGMTPAEIARRLQSFTPIHNTFEVKSFGSATLLDDTYNSSPDSMRAAIDWAAKQPHESKILVVEGIIELGTEEERIHRELAKLASPVFDTVFVVHPRYLPYFQDGGFGDRAKLAADSEPVQPDSLLVCVGRMPKSIIESFLNRQTSKPAVRGPEEPSGPERVHW